MHSENQIVAEDLILLRQGQHGVDPGDQELDAGHIFRNLDKEFVALTRAERLDGDEVEIPGGRNHQGGGRLRRGVTLDDHQLPW